MLLYVGEKLAGKTSGARTRGMDFPGGGGFGAWRSPPPSASQSEAIQGGVEPVWQISKPGQVPVGDGSPLGGS